MRGKDFRTCPFLLIVHRPRKNAELEITLHFCCLYFSENKFPFSFVNPGFINVSIRNRYFEKPSGFVDLLFPNPFLLVPPSIS